MNEEEDMILPDDFVDDTPVEANEDGTAESEVESTPAETEQEAKGEGQDNESKLLEALKGKMQYDHQEVDVNGLTLQDVITNFQKGLNYDRLQKKYEEDSSLKYLDQKAQELGYKDRAEYISAVQKYEEEARKQEEERQVQEMMAKNVPEELARKLAGLDEYKKALQAKEAQLNELVEKQQAEEKDEAERIKFIEAYPNVKAEDIPNEVWDAVHNEGKTLLEAYTFEENKKLKEKLGQYEQNESNKATSVVKSVTGSGAVANEPIDAFIEGFDSE